MTLHYAPAGAILIRAMQFVLGGLSVALLVGLYTIGVETAAEWLTIWFVVAAYLIGLGFLELSIRQLPRA